ncbi:unnamed protein product [Menidia menidia]|uniref:(Atlantic silverside) hypothetical protein n=1 Tax=Menidia menidia TaxID=238744 RepID=A0A8S4ADZ0_9TELE|nr:unnamed protein product [Menidia menidia]
MLRFIQEVNTSTRSCALWGLQGGADYTVQVQSISMSGSSPPSHTLRFRTPKEAETQASKGKVLVMLFVFFGPNLYDYRMEWELQKRQYVYSVTSHMTENQDL